MLDGATVQFLSSLGKSVNSQLTASEHTSDLKPEFKDRTLSLGITPPDSTADSLKLIKSISTQRKADSVRTLNTGFADSTRQKRTALADSADKKNDSVHVMTWRDSLMAKSLDSTARIQQFRYKRQDEPVTELSPRKTSKFFARPSQSTITRTVELDSTGSFVNIKEKIGNRPYKIVLTLPLNEYIKLQMDAHNRSLWEQLAYKYELKEGKKDIGQLITDITNIDIPLPSVGFLSIFGKRGINIRINGAVDIHGAWRNEKTEGVTASLLGNSRNEPDFKQNVQINVQGTIGDKLKIGADWNTERTFEYENQLKLTYTGYEDEIVQKVEAGNVSLQTSPLVGGSEALFGVKADFQLGPLKLTTLASQKKGEVKEVSVSGGTTAQEFQKRTYDYSPNHYFIDAVYADRNLKLFEKFYSSPENNFDDKYLVKEIEVWKSVTGQRQPGTERQANVFIDLPKKNPNFDNYSDPVDTLGNKSYRDTTLVPISGVSDMGRFVRLTENTDYVIHKETGYLTFKTQIQDDDVIAVAYSIPDPNNPNTFVTYGDMIGTATDTTVSSAKRTVLKLIKPRNLQPGFTKAWSLQLRNIYAVGGRGINQEGFKFDIQYQIPGQEPLNQVQTSNGTKKLLESFGLDKVGAGNSPGSDGEFDFNQEKTIFSETGEIIFPVLEPFGRDLPAGLNDSLRYDEIYTKTVAQARQQSLRDRFVLKGKYSASSTSVFNLGMVGIVENSVKVTLGGNELKPNVDYVVDYMVGQVTIRNRDALVPGADLKITYEQNDIFQLASKTLLGARGEFNFSKKTTLGFSALNLNQQTLTDKVRIGEEPLNNSIYGIDFGTSADLPFVTKGLDKLFSTREMSTLSLRGDFAFINPDPNTKKSPISSDGGESIAYVDDFEGSKKTIPVGLGYTSWHDLSYPNNMKGLSGDVNTIMGYKAKSWWYNITPSDVQTLAIWPQKKVSKNDRSVTVLDFVFEPSMRGTYNFNNNFVPNSKQNWGGMMKVLSSTANNLEDENIEFIEFWMQFEGRDPKNGIIPSDTLYIDLGKISGDVIPNNRLDTEDKPAGQGNGLLDNGEDVGIDGMNNQQERETSKYIGSDADPAGDDFEFTPVGPDPKSGYYNSDAYQKINGTENNSKSIEAGKLPDTEDLKNKLTLETVNSYFRYSLPLDPSPVNNKYIVGGGNTEAKWYQVRIPLKDFKDKFGSPSLSVVEYIRVWMNNTEHRVHLRFADFNLVGNQWQKVTPKDSASLINGQDTKLELSVISVDENSPEYNPPPGVTKEKDLSKPDEDVFRNEQSLNLTIHNLEGEQERQVIKTVRAMDLFNYKALKLFVHGDGTDKISPADTNLSFYQNPTPEGHNADVYFRFGADTANYYEFRQPVKPGWNEINIPFADITALKAARDAARDSSKNFYQRPFYSQVPGEEGHYFGIKGNPSLTSVNFFLIGVRNPKAKGTITKSVGVSGKIWVDEMRVIGADNHPGWAASGSVALKLADVANVSFNMSQTDPYFHKLSDRFGSRMDSRNWSVSLDLDVIKVMPFDMPGSKLRLNYQRSESISKPLYKPGTDIKLENASQELERQMLGRGRSAQQAAASRDSAMTVNQTLNMSETWSLSSIELRIPSTFWLIQETINNLRFNFSFNKTEGRNPTVSANKSWIWNFGASYTLAFGQNNFIYLADIPVFGTVLQLFTDYRNTKFYYSPQNLSLNLTTSRNYSYSLSRIAGVTPSVSRDFRQSRNGAFQWKLTDGGLLNLAIGYNVDISASLAHLLTVNNVFERREKEIWKDFIGAQFFGRPFQYSQNFDLRTSPKLPTLWNLNNYFNINAGYNASYSWANNFQQTFAGRSAGYASKISFGLKVKLKSLFEPMFKEENPEDSGGKQGENSRGNSNRSNRGRGREEDEAPAQDKIPGGKEIAKADSLAKTDSLSVLAAKKDSTGGAPASLKLKAVWSAVKSGVKFVLFDYENITLNFSQDNTLQKNGIKGEGTGFNNFWGVFRNNNNGPSRLFMLGIGSDVGPRVSAPDTGAQAITISLNDNYSQRNSIDFGTQKPLWEGAQIDLKWKVGWSMNKNTIFQVDKFGAVTGSTVTSTGTLSRSFVALPPLPLLGSTGIKKVKELYTGSNLSDAFLQGFESFPLLSKMPFLKNFTKYIPRPNWTLNWDGLEKISVFKSFAKRVSLNHAYSAEYSEGWMLNLQGTQVTQSQKINYGFQPLVGLTMTFNSLWNGNMTGNMKYSTRTGYDLGIATKNITESFSKDIGLSFSYSKSGFDLPLFGVNLKNDVEFSFSYTNTKTSAVVFYMDNFTEAGVPQDGTVRTTLEPRIKYVVSSRVTASVYYKRSSVQPEGAARITPTTTNEAGLDVHVSIQ